MKSQLLLLPFIFISLQMNADDLKTKLELSYKAFANAVTAKDAVALRKSMSAPAYFNLKNRMTATGAKFPDAFFAAGPMMLKDVNKMRYHNAVENGSTAFAVYDEKEEEEITIIILKFIKEGGDWKFDMFDMKGSDEINKAAKKGDFSFLTGKEYQPSGVVPVTPAEMGAGDYQGIIDVFGYGYIVGVTINGNEQKTTENKSSSGWINGGLKKGKNKIVITTKVIDGTTSSTVTIKIRIKADGEEKTAFDFDQKNPPALIEREFEL